MINARSGAALRFGVRGARCLAVLSGLVLAACTYRGEIDNPATIKATWFSYLNGDDIRTACAESAGDTYRLIYNADYNEQIRSYEVIGDEADGARLTVRVQGRSGLVLEEFRLGDPLAWSRWKTSQASLDAQTLGQLDRALEESGAFQPAPAGLRLHSRETFWVASLCRDGVFSFNAWRYPSARFDAVAFDEILFGHDATEVAVRAPRAVLPGDRRPESPQERQGNDRSGSTFNLLVGENGLAGHLAL
ncbi:hypothetical protein [Pelagibius sp.]|uniref:hypothetical protein n=1 Tax=Pelagibius sp. TaxID=1931238 RepID=UPI0026026583|nr:hypothetical protein [Pelagibius sp.]